MAKRVGSHLAVYNLGGITLPDGAETGLFVDSSGALLVSGSLSVGAIVPGTGATNLGKAEDAAHASGDVGVATWGVSNEAQSTFGADGDYTPHATDTKGNTMVVGNVASGATDDGRPIKTGRVYMSTQPTVTDGQRVNDQADTRGNSKVTLMTMDTANQVTTASTNSDTVAPSATASRWQVSALGLSFDGTNYNRDRTITNATNSTGTGIKAVGLVAQLDDTSPTAITENQFGNLRMTDRRELRTTALGGSTSAVTSVSDTATSTTLLTASATLTRREVIIENTSSARLYIKFGTTASATDFTMSLAQNGNMTTDYQGRIDGIWATDPNDGAAKITEVTG